MRLIAVSTEVAGKSKHHNGIEVVESHKISTCTENEHSHK